MRIINAVAVAACGLAGCGAARATSYMLPPPRVFSSPNGAFALKIVPLGRSAPFGAPSTGTLFTISSSGRERVVWKRKLLSAPSISRQIVIHHRYPIAITLDDSYQPGERHCIVVYGSRGQVVRDLSLGQILTRQEIARHVTISKPDSLLPGYRYWSGGIRGFCLSSVRLGGHDVPTLGISFHWGKSITINLFSGALSFGKEPVTPPVGTPDIRMMPGTGA